MMCALLVVLSSCNTKKDPAKEAAQQQTIDKSDQIAMRHPELSTFMHAIKVAGLADIFEGTGPFTGFLPTNEAFDKLEKGVWANLLKPENGDRLSAVLTYHIVPGEYMSSNLKTRGYQTISGKTLEVTVENGVITVNDKAHVVKRDLVGPNGVIQEIDAVLMP